MRTGRARGLESDVRGYFIIIIIIVLSKRVTWIEVIDSGIKMTLYERLLNTLRDQLLHHSGKPSSYVAYHKRVLYIIYIVTIIYYYKY